MSSWKSGKPAGPVNVLRRQLDGALFGTSLDGIAIAHEPVWGDRHRQNRRT
ncbi:MAG: triose-phosphate isomerase [Desulfosudis oleivorans]|nr:triose-phosphate isomerase [Desulfosudis oleivorans]